MNDENEMFRVITVHAVHTKIFYSAMIAVKESEFFDDPAKYAAFPISHHDVGGVRYVVLSNVTESREEIDTFISYHDEEAERKLYRSAGVEPTPTRSSQPITLKQEWARLPVVTVSRKR